MTHATLSPASRFSKLLLEHPIVDGHNDFPYLARAQLHYEIENDPDFDFNSTTCHTDLVRLRSGGVGVQFFSCYIESKDANPDDPDCNVPNLVVRDTLEQIDFVRRLVDRYSGQIELTVSANEAISVFQLKKLAVALGVEGLHQVDTSLAVLRQYFDLGVRYITLTHNCNNPFATAASSVSAGEPDHGLTPYGIQCVNEMNRLGMIVDLSHVSEKTMHDALAVSKSPVMFSHSLAYAITAHARNVPDAVLEKVKTNNGVVCVNFYPDFITTSGDGATIDDAVTHILHIVSVIGWDHVGLGSDFDGIPAGPVGLEDVSKYPDLVKKVMASSDATDAQIAKFMGGNVLRVWQENEQVARKLSLEPVTDTAWPGRVWDIPLFAKEFPEVYPGSMSRKKNRYSGPSTLNFEQNKRS